MVRVNPTRLGILTAAAAGVGLIFTVSDPTRWRFFPQCVFHQCTGLNCPGCGTTRAFRALAHGQVLTALHDNLFTVLALPLLAYLLIREEPTTIKPVWIWSLVVLLSAFWILRNIPLYPFTLLSP